MVTQLDGEQYRGTAAHCPSRLSYTARNLFPAAVSNDRSRGEQNLDPYHKRKIPIGGSCKNMLGEIFVKRHIVLVIIILLIGLFVAFSAASHPYEGPPYEAPMTFILHTTDDGRPVYTNIPKKCFSKGRLTCIQLHPVFKGPGTIENPEIKPAVTG